MLRENGIVNSTDWPPCCSSWWIQENVKTGQDHLQVLILVPNIHSTSAAAPHPICRAFQRCSCRFVSTTYEQMGPPPAKIIQMPPNGPARRLSCQGWKLSKFQFEKQFSSDWIELVYPFENPLGKSQKSAKVWLTFFIRDRVVASL